MKRSVCSLTRLLTWFIYFSVVFLVCLFLYSSGSTLINFSTDNVQSIVFGVLLLLSLGLYVTVSAMNPGIVKGNDGDMMELMGLPDPEEEHGYSMVSTKEDRFEIANATIRCPHCHVGKPARARHCSEIGACVYKLDHYCVFFCNAIGASNHVYFWWYMLVKAVVISWMFVEAISLYPAETGIGWILLIIVTIVIAINLLLIIVTLFFHTWLAFKNGTTTEFMEGFRLPNPFQTFDRGWKINVRSFCSGKVQDDWK